MQPDTLIPGVTNPQAWNRYSYVLGNPLIFSDPSGHGQCQTQEDCEDMGTTPMGTGGAGTGSGGGVNLPPEDDSWGHRDKSERLVDVLDMMENYHGEKWWSGSTPSTYEWAAFLYGEEDGTLKSHNDKLLLIMILLYKINKYGPAEFTPATNPIIDPLHEKWNFTSSDWNAIIHPNNALLGEGFSLVKEVVSAPGYNINKVPNYLYFVSSDEMSAAGVSVNDFTYNYKIASAYGGGFEVFLQAQEDFCLVTCGNK